MGAPGRCCWLIFQCGLEVDPETLKPVVVRAAQDAARRSLGGSARSMSSDRRDETHGLHRSRRAARCVGRVAGDRKAGYRMIVARRCRPRRSPRSRSCATPIARAGRRTDMEIDMAARRPAITIAARLGASRLPDGRRAGPDGAAGRRSSRRCGRSFPSHPGTTGYVENLRSGSPISAPWWRRGGPPSRPVHRHVAPAAAGQARSRGISCLRIHRGGGGLSGPRSSSSGPRPPCRCGSAAGCRSRWPRRSSGAFAVMMLRFALAGQGWRDRTIAASVFRRRPWRASCWRPTPGCCSGPGRRARRGGAARAPIFVALGGAALLLFFAAGFPSPRSRSRLPGRRVALDPDHSAVHPGGILLARRRQLRLVRLFRAWFGCCPAAPRRSHPGLRLLQHLHRRLGVTIWRSAAIAAGPAQERLTGKLRPRPGYRDRVAGMLFPSSWR